MALFGDDDETVIYDSFSKPDLSKLKYESAHSVLEELSNVKNEPNYAFNHWQKMFGGAGTTTIQNDEHSVFVYDDNDLEAPTTPINIADDETADDLLPPTMDFTLPGMKNDAFMAAPQFANNHQQQPMPLEHLMQFYNSVEQQSASLPDIQNPFVVTNSPLSRKVNNMANMRARKAGKSCGITDPTVLKHIKRAEEFSNFKLNDTRLPISIDFKRANNMTKQYSKEEIKSIRRVNNARTEARRRERLDIKLYLLASLVPLANNAIDQEKIGTAASVIWAVYQYVERMQEDISRYAPLREKYIVGVDKDGKSLPTYGDVFGMTPYNGVGGNSSTGNSKKQKIAIDTGIVVRQGISLNTKRKIENALAHRRLKEQERIENINPAAAASTTNFRKVKPEYL